MNSIRSSIAIFSLIVLLLSACGGQATEVPILLPTENIVLLTKTLTILPTSTNTVVVTDTAQVTEIPNSCYTASRAKFVWRGGQFCKRYISDYPKPLY